jgi:asparagine synthase (glutamine-hydrolysing)
MCGICGIITTGESKEIKEKDINSMANTLYHRGPDDKGIFLDKNVGLGVRRLNIIDLISGHQPIHNENKTLWIVFNGMIYNFLELHRHLEEKGHIFYTQTDTEVIVHLYEEYGSDCVLWLNGMFAFAIWQVNGETLFLARDRLGVKPLYYVSSNGFFLFASEIKAILKFPGIEKEIDIFSLSQYLTFEYIPTPNSIFKGIKKLLPAHTLVCRNGDMTISRYWNITDRQHKKEGRNINDDIYLLSGLLKDAVKMRLISDVPQGVFLSGGIDSGIITAIASILSGGRIKTFSIGFDEPSFDERNFFRQVAGCFNAEHHERIFTSRDLLDLLPTISEFLDEPFADSSILPTYLLSKFAKDHITVALCGDGGDELFAGYPTYIAHKIAAYSKLPPFIPNRYFTEIAKLIIPTSMKNLSLDFQFKRFLAGLNSAPYIRHHLWMGSFSPEDKKQLLDHRINDSLKNTNIFENSRIYFEEYSENNLIDRMQYLDIKTYLLDDLLVKADLASMANSLEVRSPFLDYRLVEFAFNLPTDFRLNNLVTKYILKEYAKGLLPKKIVYKRKKGFGIPLGYWICNELKAFVLDIFSEDKIKKEGFFQYAYIKRILKEHFANKADNHKQIWTLLMFELWLEKLKLRWVE